LEIALYLPHAVEWLTDNGSCYIADATRTFAASLGFIVCTTPVRSPESNEMAESFVKTFKRDYVYVNDPGCGDRNGKTDHGWKTIITGILIKG
jgi:transposase InsO family protein